MACRGGPLGSSGSGIRGRIHDAFLHDEANFLETGDIFERIPGYCNDVGQLAGFDCAEAITPTEQFRARHGRRAQSLLRRHPELDHPAELMRRIDVPVEAADVRTEGNLHAGLERTPE